MKGTVWPLEHVETVRRHYGRLPVSMAVRAKANELGLARERVAAGLGNNGRRLWTREEDTRLMLCPRDGVRALALELGRSEKAAVVRRTKLLRRLLSGTPVWPQGP